LSLVIGLITTRALIVAMLKAMMNEHQEIQEEADGMVDKGNKVAL
jgi:hypothetical protein